MRLLPSHEGVILDHEIKEMSGLFLDAGVEIPAIKGLMDCAEDAGQLLAPLPAKKVGGLAPGCQLIPQTGDTPADKGQVKLHRRMPFATERHG